MRFERRLQDGLRDGTIEVAFRRWKRPQVVAGRVYRSPVGLVRVDAIESVGLDSLTDADAARAGYTSAAQIRSDLRGDASLPVYRLTLHRLDDPDPRDLLAANARLTPADVERIRSRLARMDRLSSHGPWTMTVLRLIEARPAVRAPDLAASLGRETLPFKTDVRKLKALGLTISLKVGYRLSPRGRAFLDSLGAEAEAAAVAAPAADATADDAGSTAPHAT